MLLQNTPIALHDIDYHECATTKTYLYYLFSFLSLYYAANINGFFKFQKEN